MIFNSSCEGKKPETDGLKARAEITGMKQMRIGQTTESWKKESCMPTGKGNSGAVLPPLLLDDEEAIAVAVGLRTAAG
ncbi:MAG: hypothetical protein MN733_00580, partial [Nitrososphaera sp.]|nr:hypothetical protein [Nitrososphaera sp.]